MANNSNIVFRALIWAEEINIELIDGQETPVIQRSRETFHIATFDTQILHQRIAKSAADLVRNDKLI